MGGTNLESELIVKKHLLLLKQVFLFVNYLILGSVCAGKGESGKLPNLALNHADPASKPIGSTQSSKFSLQKLLKSAPQYRFSTKTLLNSTNSYKNTPQTNDIQQ
jgi:hypothetical protein